MSQNIPDNEKPKDEGVDVAAEFAEMGRKLRTAIDAAWTSEERQKIQREVKDGLDRLVKEVDSGVKNLRGSEAGQKVETKVNRVVGDIESGKAADDLRKGLVVALRGIGAALDSLAESFTPADEKAEPPKK